MGEKSHLLGGSEGVCRAHVNSNEIIFKYSYVTVIICKENRFLARLHEVHRAIAVTSVVHVPVPVPVPVPVRVRVRVRVRVTLALKFSRSPYLDNHSSESIHTWTMDTL